MQLLCVLATALEFKAFFPDWRGSLPEHCALPINSRLLGCITGVGPVNAAMALGRVLALNPQIGGVICSGLAGSFDLERAPLGTWTLATEEIYPEYGLLGEAVAGSCGQLEYGLDAEALGFAQFEQGELRVLDRLPLAAPVALGLPLAALPEKFASGPALTVAGVSASLERAGMLARRYGALSENMEGFAVALACARAALPCLELRVISNRVGSRLAQERVFGKALAELGVFGHNLQTSLFAACQQQAGTES